MLQFKHRNGEKVTHGEEDHTLTQDGEEEQATEQATEHEGEVPEEDRSSNFNNKNKSGDNNNSRKGNNRVTALKNRSCIQHQLMWMSQIIRLVIFYQYLIKFFSNTNFV